MKTPIDPGRGLACDILFHEREIPQRSHGFAPEVVAVDHLPLVGIPFLRINTGTGGVILFTCEKFL
jgi:hypothetical protein